MDITTTRTPQPPEAYVTGRAKFDDITLRVEPGAYVPVPHFIHVASEAAFHLPRGGILVDVGCGVGTIGLWVGRRRADARVVGVDVNVVALLLARLNARNLEVRANFVHGDILRSFRQRSVDAVTCTLPYDPPALVDPHLNDDGWVGQPRSAYVGGSQTGLELVTTALWQANRVLRQNGRFIFYADTEIDASVHLLFEACGFVVDECRQTDDWGSLVVVGRRVKHRPRTRRELRHRLGVPPRRLPA